MQAADPNGKLVDGAHTMAEWTEKIKMVWARGSSSTLDLARVVTAAKTELQRHYGQWSRLWKSEQKMPLSKSTADQLAVIGLRMGGLDSQTSENLPRGWNILYCLARLDQLTLEQLIQQGVVHPKLTLSHARELVAEFTGKQTAAERRRANVRERLRRFAEFVRNNVSDWEIQEKKFAAETLTQLIEEIGVSETAASKRDRSASAFFTQHGLLTDQRINL
jgi:hypothetical protein